MHSTRAQIIRFLFVGGTTVLIDFLVYSFLLWLHIDANLAKTISFSCGTVFAYFANRSITFSASGSLSRFMLFVAIYVTTLFINVGSNAAVLASVDVGNANVNYLIAFVIATGLSATLNFLGMKFFVFKKVAA